MEGYMTIGEVAKVKKITPKALRHYEKVGILKPAYTDPETGYRYYKNEQMLAVDMIKFLHILGIPLRNWKNYELADGSFDLRGLIDDGQKVADEKISELQICLNRLKIASRGLTNVGDTTEENVFYERNIQDRNVLRMEISDSASSVEFHDKLSQLFAIAEHHHLAANYPSGMIGDVRDGELTFYVYVEVYENCDFLPEFKHIPGGNYRCVKVSPKSIVRAREIYPEFFENHDGFSIVEADAILSPVHFQAYPVELQFPGE